MLKKSISIILVVMCIFPSLRPIVVSAVEEENIDQQIVSNQDEFLENQIDEDIEEVIEDTIFESEVEDIIESIEDIELEESEVSTTQELIDAISSLEANSQNEIVIANDILLDESLIISKENVVVSLVAKDGQVSIFQSVNDTAIITVENTFNVAISFTNVTLDGQQLGNGLHISNSQNININNLHITNGKADQGGAVYIEDSQVTISGGVIENSLALHGGGIVVSGIASTLTLNSNSIIRGNNAYRSGGHVYGGGLLVKDGAHANVSNTTISSNSALSQTNPTSGYGHGGGIAVIENGSIIFGNNVMIGGSDASDGNIAGNGAGLYYGQDNATTLTLGAGVSVLQNVGKSGSSKHSGGVMIDANNTAIINGAKINYNTSGYSGGGIGIGENTTLTMESGEINYNSTWVQGGGVDVGDEATFIMNNGTINYNEAAGGSSGINGAYATAGNGSNAGATVTYSYIYLNGGEINHNVGGTSTAGLVSVGTGVAGGYIEVNGATIDYNKAKRGYASGIFGHTVIVNSGSVSNNTIESVEYSSIDITGTVISARHFKMTGGKVNDNTFVDDSNFTKGLYGAIGVHGNTSYGHTSSIDISGGEIKRNMSQYGGAIAHIKTVESDETFTKISNAVIEGNIATKGWGGALYQANAPTVISGNAKFINNVAGGEYTTAGYGGAISMFQGGHLVIEDSVVFDGNHANSFGGAVFMQGASGSTNELSLDIHGDDVQIMNNSADSHGGAFYIYHYGAANRQASDAYTITGNVTIKNNTSQGVGGAFYIDDLSLLTVSEDVNFNNNYAATGAYQMTNTDDITMHQQNIKATNFSLGLEYGYNNYDINYRKGTKLTIKTVEYNLNYHDNDEDNLYLKETTLSTTLVEPEQPVREGFTFLGWSTNQITVSNDEYWNFASDTISGDATLYAQWLENQEHTVTFNTNGLIDTELGEYGSTFINGTTTLEANTEDYTQKPNELLSQFGYTFVGWYTKDGNQQDVGGYYRYSNDDSDWGEEWNFEQPVTQDMTLYARWQESTFYVETYNQLRTAASSMREVIDVELLNDIVLTENIRALRYHPTTVLNISSNDSRVDRSITQTGEARHFALISQEANFVLNLNHIIMDSTSGYGGIELDGHSTFTLDGNGTSVIKGMSEHDYGGAIHVDQEATVTVQRIVLENNSAKGIGRGGAIYAGGETHLEVKETKLINNSATYGGGIYVVEGLSYLDIDKVVFEGNSAELKGGGLFINGTSIVEAVEEEGLGRIEFEGNEASYYVNVIREQQMENFSSFAPKAETRTTYEEGRVFEIAYNNYDVNYGGEVYEVEYVANGGSGEVPEDSNRYGEYSKVEVLGSNLTREGYRVIGWNTEANAEEVLYAVGDSFEIEEDTVLYAIWEEYTGEVLTPEVETPTSNGSNNAITKVSTGDRTAIYGMMLLGLGAMIVVTGLGISQYKKKGNTQ